jgi:predicted RNase H-like nuclease (RuvC/YqgF family)
MVYDIETCHSEQKIHQLEQEIIDLKSIIKEHEESKSKLLDERQKVRNNKLYFLLTYRIQHLPVIGI